MYVKNVVSRFRAWVLYGVKFKIGAATDLRSKFSGKNIIYNNASVVNSNVGYGTYVAHGSYIQGAEIGKYCSIGPNVYFAGGTHPTRDFVSTHPAFFSTQMQSGFTYVECTKFKEILEIGCEGKEIIIGNDVWIGASVTILPGVRIGDGAIIAAGTVVYKDVEAYSIVAGCPMRVVRHRFTEEERIKIQDARWWDWDPQKLKQNADCFENSEVFIKMIESMDGVK